MSSLSSSSSSSSSSVSVSRRALKELLSDDSAWSIVQDWVKEATNHVEILPRVNEAAGAAALVEAQVTTRSPMGAIIYESGGLLIDHGFIRVLGSATEKLTSLSTFNSGISIPATAAAAAATSTSVPAPPPFLVVAFDAVGGVFAINGGGLSSKLIGKVFYYAPDALAWDALEMSYSEMLQWMMQGDLQQFYSNVRWPTWRQDIEMTTLDHCFNAVPPPWTKEFQTSTVSRKAVPFHELFNLFTQTQKALS